MGHKPSYYLRIFERLVCEVKQPVIFIPGELLQSAKCSRSRRIEIKRFGQVSYLNEFPVLSFIFPSQNHVPIVDSQAGNVIFEALEGVIASCQCATQHTVIRHTAIVKSSVFQQAKRIGGYRLLKVAADVSLYVWWDSQRESCLSRPLADRLERVSSGNYSLILATVAFRPEADSHWDQKHP